MSKVVSNLYNNYFKEDAHTELRNKISELKQNWFLSYDNVSEIRGMYSDYRSISYDLSYSAQEKYEGKEILFFSNSLTYPIVSNPAEMEFDNRQKLSFTGSG